MKNLLFVLMLLVFSLVFSSCETKQSISDEITKLKEERGLLMETTTNLSNEIKFEQVELKRLTEIVKELKVYADGKTPKYILKLDLRQSHISLSITRHIKDAANAIQFELPVDKDFYDSVQIDTKIVDEFRTGSMLLSSSFGDWEMTVKGIKK